MNNKHGTLAAKLAEFIAGIALERVPEVVIERARACLLFAYGIGIGSNNLPYAPVARKAVLEADGEHPRGATIFGDGRKTTIGGAALANATLFHGRNQEDTCGSTHTGVVVVPLLGALIEARGLPVSGLIPAVIAGYEVAGALDSAYASKTTPAGFRASPLYGIIGAAAAAARLYELPIDRTQAALANAAAFAGGTLHSQAGGTDEWRYQVGMAARTALVAVELARAGSNSAPLAFEGPAGYVRAFAKSECNVAQITEKLGRDWFLQKVAFKPYPLPAWNQTPVDLALRLRDRVKLEQVSRVAVYMNPYEVKYPGKDAKGPFANETEAKLSIVFAVGAALAHGTPTLALLLDYKNTRTSDIVKKIDVIPDPAVPRLSCRIVIELRNDRKIEEELVRTWDDYNFDCGKVSDLVRLAGRETNVPAQAYDLLENFVRQLPAHGKIADVVKAFQLMPVQPC